MTGYGGSVREHVFPRRIIIFDISVGAMFVCHLLFD